MVNDHLNFKKEQIDRLFPFYILINQDLSIDSYGSSLQKLMPDGVGKSFLHCFYLVRPELPLTDFETAKSILNQLVVIRVFNDHKNTLRGQFEEINGSNQLLFIGSPWLNSMEQVKECRLNLRDFAFHDPLIDLLHVLKAQEIVTDDFKELLKKVNSQKNSLAENKKDLQQALEKLSESEKRWVFALEGSANGVWDYNLETGEVFYSEKLKELLGYLPHEAFENDLSTWQRLVHPEDQKNSMAQLELFLQGEADSYMNEQRAMHRDGTYHWYLNRGIIAGRNKEGFPNRIIGTAEDITDRKKIMLELVKAKEIAESSDKSKRTFLANMSHEIRTPMNAIVGLSEQLNNTQLSADQQFLTRIIFDAAKSMEVLIDDILDFSKIEEGKLKLENIEFDLCEMMERTVNMFQHKAHEKNISLYLECNPDVEEIVIGDPNRLSQIMMNIIGNAIKFTSEGAIHISCEIKKKDLNFQELLFVITDTGIGISEENLKDVFRDFHQEDQTIARKYGGSGLGLAITKSLVQLMGGKIEIQSRKNVGTSVLILLPLLLGRRSVTSPSEESREMVIDKNRFMGKNVLLVEDNRVNRIVASIILKKMGMNILEAENGLLALQMTESRKFDIILMDLQMPEMDGISASIALRNRGIQTPIIAITANAVPDELNQLFEKGINDFIVKPFAENKLLQKLQAHLTQ